MQTRFSDDHILGCYVALARELGRLPVAGDMRLKRRRDSSFPNEKVFERFGRKRDLTERLRTHCNRPDLADVLSLIPSMATFPNNSHSDVPEKPDPIGYVYMLRSGRFYKIGKTNAFGRRERELAIQLPEKTNAVHTIKTDDPQGIEAYWHHRFASKRAHGEWFRLSSDDIAAFKRRRFQ